ncbi:lysylphosphatidylglycerol synthase domain-containing protein [Sphaerisporangium viridialbum]|uniref:lysylphosphatidylglycerol synthase domain-containing protein n=1 Tax=Sphaerisporangium viridialbum TaxID=46189 RepID=UPI003C75A6A3
MIAKLRAVLTAVAVLTVAAFVVLTLKDQDWALLATLTEPRALLLIGAAIVTNAVGLWFGMLSWRALVVGFGSRAGVWEGARIFFVGFLAKFVPGRVWTLLANMRMGRTVGITPAQMAALYVLNIAIASLTGLMTGLLAAPSVFGGNSVWMALAALPVVVFFARPGLAHRLTGVAARLLRRPEPVTRAPDGSVRRAITMQTLSWLMSSTHVWFLAIAMGASPLSSLLACVGAFAGAAVIGYLMVLVPDGLGVREAILLAALTGVLPLPAAGSVVLASRLLCTVTEIAVAGTALLVAHLRIRPDGNQGDEPRWRISTSQSSSTTTPPTSAA